jgi:hypothetical protein
VACDGEILKNKGDSAQFQKYASILKFPSGNQSDKDNRVIFNIGCREIHNSSALQKE